LVFYRWPTLNDDMPGINPDNRGSTQPVFQDPEDTYGTLQANVGWNLASNSLCQQFESMCHLVHDPAAATYTPKSSYLTPVVLSRGPDGKLGIPTGAAGQPDPMRLIHGQDPAENDNIYSYRVLPR